MSERKPPDVSWESWVDRQIHEGRDRGAFEHLPGHGRPIADIDRPRDELWWVRQKLRREKVSVTPPGLRLRVEARALLDGLADVADESELRARVDDLNERIRHANRVAHSGPPTTLMPFDVERLIERWRSLRSTG